MDLIEETKRVNYHSATAHYADGVNSIVTRYEAEVFFKHMNKDGSVLELGPAEGVMTDILFPYFSDYTVVDGASFFVDDLKRRYPTIKGYACLFEEISTEKKYDNIILGHVLEHVYDPVSILKICKNLLAPNGVMITAVPNAHSLHRQAAVLMNILSSENQLGETDKINGHRRVYNLPMLKEHFVQAGLKVKESSGYWLKPLSNSQINGVWSQELIDAYLKLGEMYPEIAGEIYVVATL